MDASNQEPNQDLKYSLDDDWWDYYSDQPYILRKSHKPPTTLASVLDMGATAASSVIKLPQILCHYLKPQKIESMPSMTDFVGLGVSPSATYNQAIVEMIEELGVKQLLLRVPCWHVDRLDAYYRFVEQFDQHEIVINILQNREAVQNPKKWAHSLKQIFTTFSPLVKTYQICNAVNRSKWGCHYVGQYIQLQEAVEQQRGDFPELNILGSSVIDFEPLASVRSLLNKGRYQLDGCAAALYVNRRLSPFNKQMKYFDLERKIRLAHAIMSAARQCENKLWITETNWPLLNTKPYTPNSGNPRSTVDEMTQAQYLTQYYQIAYQTRLVQKVYWWQLINPGYGLVDSRDQSLRKMPSFDAFKQLLTSSD